MIGHAVSRWRWRRAETELRGRGEDTVYLLCEWGPSCLIPAVEIGRLSKMHACALSVISPWEERWTLPSCLNM